MSVNFRTRARATMQWQVMLALLLLWCALNGTVRPHVMLGGLVVTVLVLWLFPLPPLVFEGSIRPVHLLILIGRFAFDVVVATGQLAWWVVRPAPPPASSVVKVSMRTNSDGVLTTTALMISLVPGSLPVEASRTEHALYVHFIGAANDETVTAARRNVRGQEARILRAFSSRAQLQASGMRNRIRDRIRDGGTT